MLGLVRNARGPQALKELGAEAQDVALLGAGHPWAQYGGSMDRGLFRDVGTLGVSYFVIFLHSFCFFFCDLFEEFHIEEVGC